MWMAERVGGLVWWVELAVWRGMGGRLGARWCGLFVGEGSGWKGMGGCGGGGEGVGRIQRIGGGSKGAGGKVCKDCRVGVDRREVGVERFGAGRGWKGKIGG